MRAVSRRPPNQAVSVCETLLRPLEYFDTAENDLSEIETLTILDDFDELAMNKVIANIPITTALHLES